MTEPRILSPLRGQVDAHAEDARKTVDESISIPAVRTGRCSDPSAFAPCANLACAADFENYMKVLPIPSSNCPDAMLLV